MILNPCSSCKVDPYYAASLKVWRCGYCNRAGYVGDKEGKGWNALNPYPALVKGTKSNLPNRQEAA